MKNNRATVAALLQLAGGISATAGLYLTIGLGATLIIVGAGVLALGALIELTSGAVIKGGEDGAGFDAPAGGAASSPTDANRPQLFDQYGPIDHADDHH